MPKLHELTAAYAHLDALIDDTNMTNAQLLEYAQTIEGALQDKAINIAKLIENLESTADNIETAEKRMAQRRKAIENRVKSIKDYLLINMVNSGVFVIDCPLFKISIRNNPYSVVVHNEALVPSEYKRQAETPPPTVDKKKIIDDYKQGVVVDGTTVEQTKSLIIN